jgi:hypothetical protein
VPERGGAAARLPFKASKMPIVINGEIVQDSE